MFYAILDLGLFTLTCDRPPHNYLKIEHGMSCDSFKAPMYKNDTKLFAEFGIK